MNKKHLGKTILGVALGATLQLGWGASAQAAALPTSGSCGIEINRVLATGDNAVFLQLAMGGVLTGTAFDLSLLGVLDFSHNTWSLSRLTRQYLTAPAATPTDTVTIISGTMAPGTPQSYNPSGSYPLVLTATGYVTAGSTSATVAVPPNNTTVNLLVMPVNGGKTLLLQNQTGGNGGGICQF